MLDKLIKELVEYGIRENLMPECERHYATNLILDLFQADSYEDTEVQVRDDLEAILEDLMQEAIRRGLMTDTVWSRDLFDTKLMNCMTPRPGEVIRTFWENYQKDPKQATDYFHHLCKASNYIRTQRIAKDQRWTVNTDYGELEISINLSKPEKDPAEIAAAKAAPASKYPQCMLCVSNEGYAGRINHPGRGNLRIIPLQLGEEAWGLQYSPYAYFEEHSIVLRRDHLPMCIERKTFERLFAFVEQFPHYFLGANADLPIVGGSILAHDHFQGGSHVFPMAASPVTDVFPMKDYEDVTCGIVRWPLSVLRLRGANKDRVIDLAAHILDAWRGYSDEEADILAFTGDTPHNTITPVARMAEGAYEMDLILRNNRTTDAYPGGLFHAHPEYHHIKKENIGIIEAMGLAILPARLEKEMALLAECVQQGRDPAQLPELEKHAAWLETIQARHPNLKEDTDAILKQEMGKVFAAILENAGVFKRTPAGQKAFCKFIAACNV